MKKIFALITSLLISSAVLAANETNYNEVFMLAMTEAEKIKYIIDNSGPVDKKLLRRIMDENPEFYYGSGNRMFIIEENEPAIVWQDKEEKGNWGPYTVFGYTEQQVMTMVGDERGTACSADLSQGGITNRYCHASIVKGVDRSLQYFGVNRTLAALIGASVFIPKEYLYDEQPSMSDLVIADFFLVNNKRTRVEFTAFADGALFLVIKKHY